MAVLKNDGFSNEFYCNVNGPYIRMSAISAYVPGTVVIASATARN